MVPDLGSLSPFKWLVRSNINVCSCKVVLHLNASAKGIGHFLEFFRWFENVEEMGICGVAVVWVFYPSGVNSLFWILLTGF